MVSTYFRLTRFARLHAGTNSLKRLTMGALTNEFKYCGHFIKVITFDGSPTKAGVNNHKKLSLMPSPAKQ